MQAASNASTPPFRYAMGSLLSSYTHDATNPLINLESLMHYLEQQSDQLSEAIASGHQANIEHLMQQAIPKTIAMMHTSSQQMRDMNTALNQLYHCHCDDLNDVPIKLNALIDDVVMQLDKPDHISVHSAPLPVLQADPDAMQIIFTALLSNAVLSYQSQTAAQIQITTEQRDDQLHIHIRDQGCGMIAEEVTKIFTAFYRGMHRVGKGSGIGLSMAQILLERYGSQIHCTSTLGEGSTFTIIWPLK